MAKDLMLVIDMQNVYASNGKWCCHATEDAAVNIKRVIREKPDLDVIFTRFLAPTEPRGAWQEYHRVNEDVNEDVTKNLSDKERLVYALIKKNPDITNRVLISNTNFAHATIERAVKKLKEKSLIERVGSDKTGHWKVKR